LTTANLMRFSTRIIHGRGKLFYAKELQVQIFDKGKCVYKVPEINEIRDYCREQINTLWDEVLRFENPHKYYVDLSEELWNIKNKLLKEHTLL